MKVLGINDDVTTCECCGRAGLKATVVIELDDAATVHFGRDCAAKKLGGSAKTVESIARGIAYGREWLHKTPAHTATVVANAIRVRFAACSAVGETLVFPNGVVLK